jgi:hypothetical protein
MVRKTNWSRRLPHSITPLDGEPMRTLREVVLYMDTIGPVRQNRRAWRHVAELLLDAAERNGSVTAVREQLLFACYWTASSTRMGPCRQVGDMPVAVARAVGE